VDNQIFDINGKGLAVLDKTMDLAFTDRCYDNNQTAKSWAYHSQYGLLFFAYGNDGHKFPTPLTGIQCSSIAWEWLKTPEGKASDFDFSSHEKKMVGNADHDGDNSEGWRVYLEDWGHVGSYSSGVICAVMPCYLWHGK